jgi:hypothetical protein
MTLMHALVALASPGCVWAFIAYAVLTAVLPLFNRGGRVGGFLNSCVLTLGTPVLVIFLTLSAARGMHPLAPHGGRAGFHADGREVVALISIAIVLCLALILIEFASVDTRGLPAYLVGLLTIKLYYDTNPVFDAVYPGWGVAAGIFVLVAFLAILLRLAAAEEAADIASALKREPRRGRTLVKQCLVPALNLVPVMLGICLYGASVAVR